MSVELAKMHALYIPAGTRISDSHLRDGMIDGHVVGPNIEDPVNIDCGELDKHGLGEYEPTTGGWEYFTFKSPVFVIEGVTAYLPDNGYLDYSISSIGVEETLVGLGKDLFAALDSAARHQRTGVHSAEHQRSWRECRCSMCFGDRMAVEELKIPGALNVDAALLFNCYWESHVDYWTGIDEGDMIIDKVAALDDDKITFEALALENA